MAESIILNKAGRVCSVPGVRPRALIVIDPEFVKIIVGPFPSNYVLCWPVKIPGEYIYSKAEIFKEIAAHTSYFDLIGFKPLLERLIKKYWNE